MNAFPFNLFLNCSRLLILLLIMSPLLCSVEKDQSKSLADSLSSIWDSDLKTKTHVLLLGKESSQVALNVIKQQEQARIYVIEADQASVNKGRAVVDAAGLYGRITVHVGNLAKLPFPPLYFHHLYFDCSDAAAEQGTCVALYRSLRPGGVGIIRIDPSSKDNWSDLFSTCGMQIESSAHTDFIIYKKPQAAAKRQWRSRQASAKRDSFVDCPEFKPPLIELWSSRFTSSARHNRLSPTVADGVAICYQSQFGYVRAHDAYTGALLWIKETPYAEKVLGSGRRLGRQPEWYRKRPLLTPAITGGAVLLFNTFDDLVCLDLQTGAERWKYAFPEDVDWGESTVNWSSGPMPRYIEAHGDQFYFQVNNERAVYLNPVTGETADVKPILPGGFKSVLQAGPYNLVRGKKGLEAIRDGEDQASYSIDMKSQWAHPPFCVDVESGVIAGDDFGLDLHSGKKIWRAPWLTWTCSKPITAGGYTWETASGILLARDIRNGQLIWAARNSNSCEDPVISDGILYSYSNNSLRMRAFVSENTLLPPGLRAE